MLHRVLFSGYNGEKKIVNSKIYQNKYIT